MGFKNCSKNIEVFQQIYILIYMVYNQTMVKSSCGRFQRTLQIWKKWKDIFFIDLIIIVTICNSFIHSFYF
jgi:uncharacterized membrane protein YobD (UPF0266 family)